MDPFLKIVMKLDSASNYEFGTDEELFSSAIDDLLAMPGSYEDNLKSLNSLISTHTNKQYSTEDGKEIDVPVFNAKSLDSLIDEEMTGDERAEFRKKAGFDHQVRVKNKGRQNRFEKRQGFLNLDKIFRTSDFANFLPNLNNMNNFLIIKLSNQSELQLYHPTNFCNYSL